MIEDKLLIWKFQHGSNDALARIYEKYEGYLLTMATALLNNVSTAEDVVHDFLGAFLDADPAARAQFFVYVLGFFLDAHVEVSYETGDLFHLTVGQQSEGRVGADVRHLGGEDAG